MTTQPQIVPEMFLHVLQELLRVPGITHVNILQVITPSTGIADALGGVIPPTTPAKIIKQEFTPENLLAGKEKSVNFPPGNVGVQFEVFGTLPKPTLPAPGFINMALAGLQNGRPIPIMLVWTQINLETFEYHAISQGPPLLQRATGIAAAPALSN